MVTLNVNGTDLINQECEENRYLKFAADAFPIFVHFKAEDDRDAVVMVNYNF